MQQEIEMIDKAIVEAKARREKCDLFLKTARGAQKDKLERTREFLETRIHRLAACKDILEGRAFVVEDSAELTLARPTSPSTAKKLDLAEKLGARVVCGDDKGE